MSIQSEISRIQSNVQDTINVIQSTGVTVPSGATSDNLPGLAAALANEKQDKLTGTQGQVVGFDAEGNAVAQSPASSGVTSFEGRTGAVTAQQGDYTAAMVGAVPTSRTVNGKALSSDITLTAGDVGAGPGKRTARFTVGTSAAGWTSADCDYLCDGTADDVEINAAIQALPSTGGEIVILDGTYNITATIAMNKDNVKLSGNGAATVLKRMWNSSVSEGVITVTAANGGCCIENLQIDGNKATYTSNSNHGIYLRSNNNTVTGNTCNNNNGCGIYLYSSDNNTITGNTCIRGTGQASDYTSTQYTIRLRRTGNNYNLIACNNIMGKNYTSEGGTGNTFVNNKFE